MNVNNETKNLKKDILVRIAKLQLAGNLEQGIRSIPLLMAPKGKKPFRCCVYHDREILRIRTIASLGHSVEGDDEIKLLDEYAREALSRESPTEPMLTILDEACNSCVKSQYMVTNVCRACVARPCVMNCPKKCVSVENGRARIDAERCVNCGACLQNCPYRAIVKVPVPCEEACPVNAITKDKNGKEQIDYDKCIFCGACMRECPFGAMMDKSQLVDVIRKIMEGKKVVALYAPSVAAQFSVSPGCLASAFCKAGFDHSLEVAVGADITADREAHEFKERIARGDRLMTTSCCPAYVRAVKIHVPELVSCVSDTRSPMHYTAEIAKEDDPSCVTVFVGPCLSKRKEGLDDPFVDYVLSAEELGAFFAAKEIDVRSCVEVPLKHTPTASARAFAHSGGVAEAVRLRVKDACAVHPFVINGLDRNGMRQLAAFGKGEPSDDSVQPNLVEVMACTGGCIAGPCVTVNQKTAAIQLKKYVERGIKDN